MTVLRKRMARRVQNFLWNNKSAEQVVTDILAMLPSEERFCADCGATVFIQPDMMGCHCRNAAWHRRAA